MEPCSTRLQGPAHAPLQNLHRVSHRQAWDLGMSQLYDSPRPYNSGPNLARMPKMRNTQGRRQRSLQRPSRISPPVPEVQTQQQHKRTRLSLPTQRRLRMVPLPQMPHLPRQRRSMQPTPGLGHLPRQYLRSPYPRSRLRSAPTHQPNRVPFPTIRAIS